MVLESSGKKPRSVRGSRIALPCLLPASTAAAAALANFHFLIFFLLYYKNLISRKNCKINETYTLFLLRQLFSTIIYSRKNSRLTSLPTSQPLTLPQNPSQNRKILALALEVKWNTRVAISALALFNAAAYRVDAFFGNGCARGFCFCASAASIF